MRVILIVLCCILFIALIIFGMIYQRKMRLKRQEQHLKGEPKEALLYALSRMDALCEAENLEKSVQQLMQQRFRNHSRQ